MPDEVRDTVKLYLAGHIVHWWAQCDAPGVVFVFAATSVEAVERLMADLPLEFHSQQAIQKLYKALISANGDGYADKPGWRACRR